MSKNISIAEGGVARQFTNDKLKINLVGGGTEYFVPESGVQLGTKSITQNGTYAAASDGKYGYSQVTVNIRGGNGSAGSDGKPNTSGTGPLPGGAGSAVVGTDPTTGNDYAVGVDEDGELVTTPVPSAIQIITPPTKTAYTYQENMDYTGIVVAAKKKDGTTFTDARYTNGHIPMGELIFPVTEAPAGSGVMASNNTGNELLDACLKLNPGEQVFFRGPVPSQPDPPGMTCYQVNVANVPVYVCIVNDSGVYYGAVFAESGCQVHYTSRERGDATQNMSWDSTIGLYAWYDINGDAYSDSRSDFASNWPTIQKTDTGYITSKVTIPVKWLNPYTGDTHQDTFQITSTSAGGDAHTSTGSSGSGGTTVDNEGVSGTEGGF